MSEAVLTDANDCGPLEDWEVLTEVLLKLVTKPDQVHVNERCGTDATHLTIHVADEDRGKVIGKNGETVSLLRKLFGRIAASRGRKVFIEVYEPAKINAPTRAAGYRRNAAA